MKKEKYEYKCACPNLGICVKLEINPVSITGKKYKEVIEAVANSLFTKPIVGMSDKELVCSLAQFQAIIGTLMEVELVLRDGKIGSVIKQAMRVYNDEQNERAKALFSEVKSGQEVIKIKRVIKKKKGKAVKGLCTTNLLTKKKKKK